MKRIAIFSDTYLPQINGVTETIVNIDRELQESELDVRLFVPRVGRSVESSPQVFTYPGLKFILYPELEVAVPVRQLVDRKLDDFRPDIIQLMTPFSMGYSGLRYGLRHGIPTLGAYLTDFPPLTVQYGVKVMERPLARYMRWFYSRCDLTLFPSNNLMSKVCMRGITNGALWRAGFNPQQFSPYNRREKIRNHFADQDEALILFVGRLAAEKEIDALLAAVDILRRREIKHRLLVVGDGPSRSHLEQIAGDNVIFAGYQTGKELQAIYASADIFAYPSPYESFGMAVLEAMASGLPVAAVASGGVTELVVDNYNGLTFDRGDFNRLADQLELLITNPGLRRQLGQNACEYAQQYTWKQSCRELLESYNLVLSNQAADMEIN